MSLCHAIVWFDRREARVFQVTSPDASTRHLSSRRRTCAMVDPPAGAGGDAATAQNRFFETIVGAIGNADDWVITAPSGCRGEFLAWLRHTWPTLLRRVAMVRDIDDPTDGELLTLATSLDRPPEQQVAA